MFSLSNFLGPISSSQRVSKCPVNTAQTKSTDWVNSQRAKSGSLQKLNAATPPCSSTSRQWTTLRTGLAKTKIATQSKISSPWTTSHRPLIKPLTKLMAPVNPTSTSNQTCPIVIGGALLTIPTITKDSSRTHASKTSATSTSNSQWYPRKVAKVKCNTSRRKAIVSKWLTLAYLIYKE